MCSREQASRRFLISGAFRNSWFLAFCFWVPEGPIDNSPAIYRRVMVKKESASRMGRLNEWDHGAGFQISLPVSVGRLRLLRVMSDTYISVAIHFVFSTKNWQPLLTDPIRERVWAYMGGIARENRMKALCIGGVADHVHLLISMSATVSLAQAMQWIKGGTTTWIHATLPGMGGFAWQEGYGAFAVNESAVDDTIAYIQNQAVHHRGVSFQEEFVAFLKANRVVYNEKYLWD